MENGLFIDEQGNRHYYLNNQLHRLNGPAFEGYNGSKWWYQYGKIHREDGPAIEFADDNKEWYYQNEKIDCSSQQEFEKLIKMKVFW